MKCLAILGKLSIDFFTGDEEYVRYLNIFSEKNRYELSTEANVNMTAVQMQFLPLMANLQVMSQVNTPIKTIETNDGHHFVVAQYDEYQYVGMSNEDSREFVAGQLALLRDMVGLLYGPVPSMLNPSWTAKRTMRWNTLKGLMETVHQQRQAEQSFLVQAIELIRSQHVGTPSKHALECSIKSNTETSSRWGEHALLLVGNKLLGKYSKPNAAELNTRDLFLLTLCIQDMLGRESILEVPNRDELMASPTKNQRGRFESIQPDKGDEGEKPVEPERVHSPSVRSRSSEGSEQAWHDVPLAYGQQNSVTSLDFESPMEKLSSEIDLSSSYTPGIRFASPLPVVDNDSEESSKSDSKSDKSDKPASGGNVFHEARANYEAPDVPVAEIEAMSLHDLRRETVYLHTRSNNYAPYILHCAEVAPSIALVVLSQGRHQSLAELMHAALNSARKIEELGTACHKVVEARRNDEHLQTRIHMAVRGATQQVWSADQINGDYVALPEMHEDRPVFERTSKDGYLYYHGMVRAWCISPDIGDISHCSAMVKDEAETPDLIAEEWEVYDYDVRDFYYDPKIKIRCVRGDGALRNRDGRWAFLSTNSKFYCGGEADCACEQCDGKCGLKDGCNCQSCKLLDGSQGFGNTKLAAEREKQVARVQMVVKEGERTLKLEIEKLIPIVKKLGTLGGLKKTGETLQRTIQEMQNVKKDGNQWDAITEKAENFLKIVRTQIGEAIATSNETGDPEELECMEKIREGVAEGMKDYLFSPGNFFQVKIHRNVTMTSYMNKFPGLVHFIYVDRHKDVVVAPCLSPAPNPEGVEKPTRPGVKTLKTTIWEMHSEAQRRLMQGNTSMSITAGDFRTTYVLWFEDAEGVRLGQSQELQKSDQPITGQFYKDLVAREFTEERAGNIKCYELFMIHLSSVPHQKCLNQGRDLVDELKI